MNIYLALESGLCGKMKFLTYQLQTGTSGLKIFLVAEGVVDYIIPTTNRDFRVQTYVKYRKVDYVVKLIAVFLISQLQAETSGSNLC